MNGKTALFTRAEQKRLFAKNIPLVQQMKQALRAVKKCRTVNRERIILNLLLEAYTILDNTVGMQRVQFELKAIAKLRPAMREKRILNAYAKAYRAAERKVARAAKKAEQQAAIARALNPVATYLSERKEEVDLLGRALPDNAAKLHKLYKRCLAKRNVETETALLKAMREAYATLRNDVAVARIAFDLEALSGLARTAGGKSIDSAYAAAYAARADREAVQVALVAVEPVTKVPVEEVVVHLVAEEAANEGDIQPIQTSVAEISARYYFDSRLKRHIFQIAEAKKALQSA